MKNNKYCFYNKLAKFYDDFYRFKDYKAEVAYFYKIFKTYKNIQTINLLDVGCGTGGHLKYFLRYFKNIYGLDPNKPMINIAKSKLGSEAKFFVKPIQEFKYKPVFNLITSFNSALNYVVGYDELLKSMKNIYSSLSEKGVAVLQLHNCIDKDFLFSTEANYKNERLIVVGDWQRKTRYGLHSIDFFYHLNSRGKWSAYHDVHKEYFYRKGEIYKAMKTAGFQKIKIQETKKKDPPFKSSEFICSAIKV